MVESIQLKIPISLWINPKIKQKTEFLGDQIAKNPKNGLKEGQGVKNEYIFRLICPPQFI